LRGDAFKWFQAAVVEQKKTFANYEEFEELFKSTFGKDVAVHQDKAFKDLTKLQQTKSCQAYSTKFVQMAAQVNVDENTKMQLFKQGLKQNVQLHLIGLQTQPTNLTALIAAAVQYDDAFHLLTGGSSSKQTSHHQGNHPPSSGTNSGVAPMDIDATQVKKSAPYGKLTSEERQRRLDNSLCLYCGKTDCGGSQDVNKCATLIQRNAGKGGKQNKH
jgi:hypothetical protein